MKHPVFEFQIISKDPDLTGAFYSQLFGWTVSTDNALGYRRIQTGSDEGIQGGIWPAPPQASTFVQLFIGVDDVAVLAQKAESMGATLVIPPTTLPDGDEVAVLRDPQGLPFGVWRRSGKTGS